MQNFRVKTTGVVEYSFMMKNGSDHKEILMVSIKLLLIYYKKFELIMLLKIKSRHVKSYVLDTL